MFNSFRRRIPEISIFHYSNSPPSSQPLNLLKTSLSEPYPPGNEKRAPLEFNLSVVEASPNPDQMKTILSYLSPKALSPPLVFLSAHPSAHSGDEQPTTTKAIAELAQKNPHVLKWPIVVDWEDGKASVGDVEGVRTMLETLRKRRDGELPEEQIHKPGWFF